MLLQICSLIPHVTRLSLQVHAADRRSVSSGNGYRLLFTCQARPSRVMALDAVRESSLLQDAAITISKHSHLRDQDAQTVSASDQLDTVRKEDKFFEVEMTVREDELDEYGVVNNAVYVSYIHRGRDLLLEKLGFGVGCWAAMGKAMALSELNLKYFAPLKSGDRFVVKIKPVKIKGTRMIIHHMVEMLPERKLVLEAKGTVVFLNKDYRPTRVFPELSAKTRAMFTCMER
ncbi:hypothetical protein EJB05_54112 [Eragrostis curvula]|uniref:Uncharacterized protein n=1 Tax=Eragrostis curvula TaxID=38414 RepID=A0A5J9SLW8_9POAL|nr:hypothetical protein EJB05_54612 [Eragrostis curvula]TVU00470.1 hypothetical protein EJB05_54112 [Eragrostis curvula]